MRKYLARVYNSFCSSMKEFAYFASLLGEAAILVALSLTLPLWAIPYAIYRRLK